MNCREGHARSGDNFPSKTVTLSLQRKLALASERDQLARDREELQAARAALAGQEAAAAQREQLLQEARDLAQRQLADNAEQLRQAQMTSIGRARRPKRRRRLARMPNSAMPRSARSWSVSTAPWARSCTNWSSTTQR